MPTAPLARVVDAALEATVVLSFSRIGHVVRSRLDGWTPTDRLDGRGRTIVVTGANSGLGYATARGLLRAGAAVRITVRSHAKGEEAIARLTREVGGAPDVRAEVADLTDLASVRALAERLVATEPRIDAVVHNAGAMFDTREETVDGLERTYQVHVVGPHLLTSLLLPTLRASAPARILTVTSGGMYAQRLDARSLRDDEDHRPALAYARAKRAQVAMTERWAARADAPGVSAHVVHPGWALTPGVERSLPRFRRLLGPVLRDAGEGAETIVWATLTGDLGEPGRLWHDRRPRSRHRLPWTRTSPHEADRLWDQVERDAGLHHAPTVVS